MLYARILLIHGVVGGMQYYVKTGIYNGMSHGIRSVKGRVTAVLKLVSAENGFLVDNGDIRGTDFVGQMSVKAVKVVSAVLL